MDITTSTAPDLAALQPMKPGSESLPVHLDLTEKLVGATVHPDPMVADVLAACSGYAYGQADTVATIMARKGLEKNRTIMISEIVDAMFVCSTAFVVQSHDGRVVILCFRGTQPTNLVNWLLDADLYPERVNLSFQGAPRTFEVHGGFYRNVLATRHEVVAALKRAASGHPVAKDGEVAKDGVDGEVGEDREDRKDAELARVGEVGEVGEAMLKPMEALYITGHSLGAAMAAITAVMFAADPQYKPIADKLRAVYTFGQPMIGGPDLARACNDPDVLGRSMIRYVNGNDVVPQLPPRQAGSFEHFGKEFKNDPFRDPRIWKLNDPPTTQLKHIWYLVVAPLAFLAGQFRKYRKIRFRASLYDHFPQHYIAALTSAGSRSEYGD